LGELVDDDAMMIVLMVVMEVKENEKVLGEVFAMDNDDVVDDEDAMEDFDDVYESPKVVNDD
jgi:hypothetical protein